MLFTLALIIFVTAIICFFSQEFARTFKRIFEIPGAKLLLPLAIASWLVLEFDYWLLWALYYTGDIFRNILIFTQHYLPAKEWIKSLNQIILLSLFSILPVITLDYYYRYKTYHGLKYPYLISGILWLIGAFLLVTM